MSDPLKDYNPPNEGSLFVRTKEGEPVKLRVLTLDPLVALDDWGNTRYSFVVWNHTEEKAQILNKGWSVAGEIQKIHKDEDFGADIQKVDIKITTTGEGKETRYSINPLPNSGDLKKEWVDEAAKIKLEEVIKNGTRMSKLNSGQEMPQATVVTASNADVAPEEIDDSPLDLSDIPF